MSDAGPVISDEVKAKSEARHAQIIGEPRRIDPMTDDEVTEEIREITLNLRKAANLPMGASIPEFLLVALKHHKLYMANLGFAVELMGSGALSPRDRELLILRVGWLTQAPYEWGEHVAASYRMTDLTTQEIDRVTYGSSAEGWSRHEAALLRSVEELLDDAMITDETWATLAETFSEQQLMELCLLVGQYCGTAFLQNSIRARLMPGGKGLAAR